jgi:hypothetical protein
MSCKSKLNYLYRSYLDNNRKYRHILKIKYMIAGLIPDQVIRFLNIFIISS